MLEHNHLVQTNIMIIYFNIDAKLWGVWNYET